MSYSVVAALSPVANDFNGFVTAQQAHEVGVKAMQLKSMADAGVLERVSHGLYRFHAAPDREADPMFWRWLSISKGVRVDQYGLSPVVAAGETAAELHQIGDFLPPVHDFIVNQRRFSRLEHVRLRKRSVLSRDVTFVDSIPTLTVEATIDDLFAIHTDVSLIADAYNDARRAGKITRPDRLAELLRPYARRYGHTTGDSSAVLDLITSEETKPTVKQSA